MTSSAAWTFALHASRACCAAVLAGSVVTEGDGLDTAVLGACDSALVVLDSPCGPAVVALGQNFTAANEPPTRSAAAIASGMMTRAGWAFARRACTTFPPKDSPVPPNLLEDAPTSELPTAQRDGQQRQRIAPWRTANQAPGWAAQRRHPLAS